MRCTGRHISVIVLLLLVGSAGLFAQLSPGKLARPHADLEGLSNCTKCHELGKKVTNAKCLDCHKIIRNLIRQKRGYHASKEVRNKNCYVCHNDHHGRNFQLIRFDEKNFDHDLAGYPLKGAHRQIDCRKCHIPDNIANNKIKFKEKTFLGLSDKCVSCHEDYHQKTLGNDCAKCHNEKKFSPAPKFDHDDAKYKLRGKHTEVKCIKCHRKDFKNGKKFQFFTGLKFDDCVSCHKDPHRKQLPGRCDRCHTEKSFSIFSGRRKFDHSQTHFKLRGKHRLVSCFECHKRIKDPKQIFQDKRGVTENQCVSCHKDVHDGKLGTDCVQCHSVNGFGSKKATSKFNHDLADFHLEGKHVGVDCKKCHKKKLTDPLLFDRCDRCHEDYHRGEFGSPPTAPDCAKCHSVKDGFDLSFFDLDDHRKTDFPLEGAHEAVACFECHIKNKRWTFRNIGDACKDCHTDIHEGLLDAKYYPDKDCTACHSPENWVTLSFEHEKTDWPLEGKHKNVACHTCHFIKQEGGDTYLQRFKGIEKTCSGCHADVHDGQFASQETTDCARCHSPSGWSPADFDHNKTKFPLRGKHKEIECRACHWTEDRHGKPVVVYKIGKTKCSDCHS